MANSVIYNGGHTGGMITSVSTNTAAVNITSDIGGGYIVGTDSMAFDPTNDAITIHGNRFCGPSAPPGYCGA